MSDKKAQRPLRSHDWFGGMNRKGFAHRSWMRNQGFPSHLFDGRPVIGVCNTWSELTPCNSGLRDLAEHVKRGVYEMGGFPLEFPVTSLGETIMRPTTMMFRNLVSMDVEESIRANPLDGVVLLVGCDKTTPALLMGAASCDLPTITVSAGPMMSGHYKGEKIGSGTHIYRFADEVEAGTMTLGDFMAAEQAMSPSPGTCMTMGTASTLSALTEALGVSLPHNSATPAMDARRKVLAHESGRRIVEMVHEDLRLSKILTPPAFENAVRLVSALGGSTNAVVHLLALAGRCGVAFTLADWDRLARDVPCLVNLLPSGEHLMADFFRAGGVPAVMREIADLLDLEAPTVTGRTLGENIIGAECFDRDVILPRAAPFKPEGGLAVLRGNLAPDGAVLKVSAASPELMRHTARALVFDDIHDYRRRIGDPDLDVEADDILVLRNCGPRGYPGFPEVGNLSLPPKLLKQGVRDMVRISDARMSGTAYGTVILHVAPEAAVGGVLGLVRTGDRIELDVPARSLALLVSEEELAARRDTLPKHFPAERGYARLYQTHVLQADQGADFDFLRGGSGAAVPLDSH